MSEIETIIRYDGPALAGHDMDVEELAPALLALASLIQSANHKFNGDRSAVRVVVNADLEQQCFQIKIKLIQDLLSAARNFLDGDMATIKNICEWIGIVGTPTMSLFALLIKLGKKQQDQTVFKAEGNEDATIIQIQTLNLHPPPNTPPQVAELLNDPAIVAKAKDVMKPAIAKGYDTVSFHEPGKPTPVFEARSDEVRAALNYDPPMVEEPPASDDDQTTPIQARVFVKTQRNEGRGQWELKWANRAENASIDDLDWLGAFQRGEVPHTNPFYLDVQMDMVTSKTNPDAPARFHVKKVLGVPETSNPKQGGFFDGE